MNIFHAILVAIVEGVTEFLPISSTAHMVITSSILKIADDPFTKYFEINIQFGAILSVIFLYLKRFLDFKNIGFYIKLLIAVIPALLLGFVLNDFIDAKLESPLFIAIVMIAGGILLLFVDKWFNKSEIQKEEQISYTLALKIGLFQCLSIMFPGLSRSAATIVGAMSQKVSRHLAAEFSFFLAVPTMFAATTYKTISYVNDYGLFTSDQMITLAVGNIVAFIVAILAIRFFVGFVQKRGFKLFGYYRIALGVLVLILIGLKVIS